MEKIELNITYQVSDLVSASLAYRKYVQDKTLIFIAWLFTVYVLGTYLLPTLFFTLFCIPFHSCSSVDLWNIVKIFSLSIFSCSFMFFLAYSNFWHRIKAEYVSRLRLKKLKEIYQETKIIACEDGLVLCYKTYKITIYWSSFQDLLESRDSFLLPVKKYNYIVVPKRVFDNLEDIKRFGKIIATQSGRQIISI